MNIWATSSVGTNKKDDGSNGRVTLTDTKDPLKATTKSPLVTTSGAHDIIIKASFIFIKIKTSEFECTSEYYDVY